MASQRSFGRRANPQLQRRAAVPQTVAVLPCEQTELKPAAAESFAPPPKTAFPSHIETAGDAEPARRYRIPWRQLSLMASLCFGIASFVLPDTVNDNVQWLLYALMAASLYAGFSKRLRRAMG